MREPKKPVNQMTGPIAHQRVKVLAERIASAYLAG
jgi:hypothetical protein